ncbi:MAG: glycosyltransferase family 2 protein [Sulfurospirillaceae bacterium]|nr:glycosyltransferase family 2 protein [Sulfurospirillaceae bacterium]
MKKSDILVVVPSYNNPNSIENVAKDILGQGYKLVLVDDGSIPKVDFEYENLTILRHDENLGKGMAIMSGAKEAKRLGYKYFVSLDGDGQHLASEIEKLIKSCDGEDQIIIGARNFDIQNVPNGSKFGRWFSNLWACWDTGQHIGDSLSGLRLYPISILDLKLKTRGFDWEMEVLVKHAWKGRIIKEKNIKCYYPKPEERVSHFKKFRDTMAIVWVHIRLLPLKPILKRLPENR